MWGRVFHGSPTLGNRPFYGRFFHRETTFVIDINADTLET